MRQPHSKTILSRVILHTLQSKVILSWLTHLQRRQQWLQQNAAPGQPETSQERATEETEWTWAKSRARTRHLHPHKRTMDCPHETFTQILWQNSLPFPEKHQCLRAHPFLGTRPCQRGSLRDSRQQRQSSWSPLPRKWAGLQTRRMSSRRTAMRKNWPGTKGRTDTAHLGGRMKRTVMSKTTLGTQKSSAPK